MDDPSSASLLELLDLERIEQDLYRANHVFDDPYPLYGGQVLAQALRAAGSTVEGDRLPHSLHGYFLRAGDATRPTLFRVDRDRDGRSYSARRVVAVQDGAVILNMSCSFHVLEDGRDVQVEPAPDVPAPSELPDLKLARLFGVEARDPGQVHPDAPWPTRFWARCREDLGEDLLLHACALTYLSDISTGLSPYFDGGWGGSSSLDHALWFHRPLRLDDWVLVDLAPRSIAAGRGWYTGTVHDARGRLGASLTQETLYRQRPVADRVRQPVEDDERQTS